VIVDGKTLIARRGQTSVRRALGRGRHTWSVSAYDLSGNVTAAGRLLDRASSSA
jgi:hypothetical protein